MDKDYYEFDPRGDIELVFNRNEDTLLVKCGYEAKPEGEMTTIAKKPRQLVKFKFSGALSKFQQIAAQADQNAPSKEMASPQDVDQVRIRVSSQVLSLASPYFRKMLQGNSKEAQELQLGKTPRVPTKHCKTGALLVLLSVLHFRSQNVPQAIEIPTAIELALLVDMWNCYDAVKVYALPWMEAFHRHNLRPLSLFQCHWIFIAWVFEDEQLFTMATHAPVRDGTRKFQNLFALPIPERIVKDINCKRLHFINHAVMDIYRTYEDLVSREICTCNTAFGNCDCRGLGNLVKLMRTYGLPIERPAKPYDNLSVGILVNMFDSAADEGSHLEGWSEDWDGEMTSIDRCGQYSFGLQLKSYKTKCDP